MLKAENHRVQALTLKMKRTFCRPVYRISQKRMSDTGHVYADLVCASGLETAFDVGVLPKTFQYAVMSDCRFAVPAVDRHALPVGWVAPDRSLDGAGVIF